MKKNIDYILSNLIFISRIPVKVHFEYRSDAGNVKFFPLVGVIIGWILFLAIALLKHLFSTLTNSAVLTLLLVGLTGGIHLDGLSDTADGMLSYRSSDRIIEIMKDSQIGAMGALSLILLILLKIAFFNEILLYDLHFFVLLFPVFGRLSIVNACFFGKPIEKSSLGRGFIGNMTSRAFIGTQLAYYIYIAGVVAWLSENIYDMLVFLIIAFITQIVLIVLAYYIVKRTSTKIGGISGDILGAVCEIGETMSMPIFLVGIILCEKFI